MRWFPLLVAVQLATPGCGPEALGPGPAPASKPPPKLHDGPLTDYVPAGGINWLILGKPRALSSDRALAGRLELLLSKERLDLYADHTGIDLRELTSAAIVGFDLGTLFLAETDKNLTLATQVFVDRMHHGANIEQPHPRLTRITGVVGRTPQSLLWQDGKLLAVAVGDTTATRIVEAFARNKLKRAKSVFDGAALQSFRDFGKQSPLLFLAPGPFEGRWIYGANGLLSVATALGISATPIAGETLSVQLAIDGHWDENSRAVTRLRQAWEDLAFSSTGRLFGLDQPVSAPGFESTPERVTLSVSLALAPIVHGLRAAVIADVWEMLDLDVREPDAASPNPPTPQ